MGINRRKFLIKAGISGTVGLVSSSAFPMVDPFSLFPTFNFGPDPSEIQKSWTELKLGMFIHFGINTYYDKEWSDGTLDPYRVNPARLETDRWCQVAKSAGMKYIVIVAKHHDGFCLWPSRHTDYTIARSQYNRDIIDAITNSASKYGLKIGFYYSLWDQRESVRTADEWKFIHFIENQLQELLTNYGPILKIWFDGFWERQQSGWEKKVEGTDEKTISEEDQVKRNEGFIDAWRMEGVYRWQMDHLYNYIKSMQSDCLVMINSTGSYPGVPLFPVDIRNGERYTRLSKDRKIWKWLGKDVYLPLQIETTLSTKGNQRFPLGNWFWHEWDHSVLLKDEIINYQDYAQKNGANLLLNVGPDRNGELRKEDEAVLSTLG